MSDEEVRKLVLAAGLSGNDRVQSSVRKAVLSKAVESAEYPFDSVHLSGHVELGETFQGQAFSLSEDDLAKHLLAVGQSGSGKTTLFYNLYSQVGRPSWFFDLKQDYRHLIQRDDLLVLPWSEFKFNPLRPPSGVSPRRWAQVFSEIFGYSTALLSGSKNYLLKKLIELYRLYGLFDQVSGPFPSLHELEILVRSDGINYARASADYRDRLLNRLEALNLIAGSVFDCSQGYSIEELLQRDVVFEFDGLSRDVQNLLMEALFAYVYEYRLAQDHRGKGLNHLFFLDEGKQVFSVYKERQDASGIPEIDVLTAKMREFGEGLVVGDQEASKLTDSIKANTHTKVLLTVGDRKQFDAVAGSMDLSRRQMRFASELGVGEAVVRAGNRGPVPVKLDDYELEKDLSDEEIENRMAKEWAELDYTERETTRRFRDKIAPGRTEKVEEPEILEDPEKEVELTKEADCLLKDVIENPFKALTQRYDLFSSRYKGNKAKDELVDKGILFERQVKTGDRKKLLELTDKGREYAENSLELELKHRGRGGVVHRYWQHRIKDAFEEAGWHAFLEKFDADVYVNMGNNELVVEVAMGDNPREIDHIKKHLDTSFTVWIAARNKEVLDGLKKRMNEEGLDTDRVAFRLVRDFSDPENLPV
ncbi:ATP-binding protein [Halorubrum vacuolatum]|uniref:ATP-binding protein n=1 Tax=Halorubrum vacuolatum TaxID=63740 RepID=UPI001FE28C8A|nr:ATP-binding protein [Halorubrum vacuolatum]